MSVVPNTDDDDDDDRGALAVGSAIDIDRGVLTDAAVQQLLFDVFGVCGERYSTVLRAASLATHDALHSLSENNDAEACLRERVGVTDSSDVVAMCANMRAYFAGRFSLFRSFGVVADRSFVCDEMIAHALRSRP